MDTEAKMILDDTISFCERDERDGRLINILNQCVPAELTETSLTIEAPTRFAYSYLLKQRDVIERYLEEITFGPLALNVTVPESITAGHHTPQTMPAAPAPVSRETGSEPLDAGGGAAPSTSASLRENTTGVGMPMSNPTDDAGFTNTASGAAPGAAAMPSVTFHVKPAVTVPSSHAAATSETPGATAASAPATERHHLSLGDLDDAPAGKVKVTNVLSPDAFRQLTSTVHASEPPTTRSAGISPEALSPTTVDEDDDAPIFHVHSKFTFENFVYGDENKHAYQSAVRFAAMADEPGTCTSLFIYGKSGLGKTHLLLAIKNYLNEHSPHLRVKYANSQTYVEDYISELALSKNRAGIILRDYHDADVLIIDDIQNIIGKTQSIENFFSLMDEFIRNNKKIAIASDRAPKNLGMDERLTSRFNAGMLCLVSEPGFEMKYMILKHYYENTVLPDAESEAAAAALDSTGSLLTALRAGGGTLTDEQLRHMAEVSGTNIRELESFCERCAGASFECEQDGRELTGDEIDRIANEYFDAAHKHIHIDTVQHVVEEFYHVSHEDLIGPRRTKNIAFARHVAIYLAMDMCEMTTPMVGAEFGGRNHSTVLSSIKVVEKKIKEDRSLCEDLQAMRNKIILKS